ncbi:Hpt domain-containing protein, partial [Stieleria sp.]|uniref:Hpt domain-containing protein n=1 Tax=Stieleria sp. TaxID=2795976 RepID=UPI003562F462
PAPPSLPQANGLEASALEAGARQSAPQPSSPDNAPIECTLPLDDEDYLDIVVDFLQQLDVRLMGMLSMVQTKSFDELYDEAHWLKGSGGTVGFPAFTDPALALMNASERRDVRQCQESLRDVLAIRQRLVVPHTSAPAPAESIDAR